MKYFLHQKCMNLANKLYIMIIAQNSLCKFQADGLQFV